MHIPHCSNAHTPLPFFFILKPTMNSKTTRCFMSFMHETNVFSTTHSWTESARENLIRLNGNERKKHAFCLEWKVIKSRKIRSFLKSAKCEYLSLVYSVPFFEFLCVFFYSECVLVLSRKKKKVPSITKLIKMHVFFWHESPFFRASDASSATLLPSFVHTFSSHPVLFQFTAHTSH